MKKVKITLVAVLCVLAVLGIALAQSVSDSGQHLNQTSYYKEVSGSNGGVRAYGSTGSAYSKASNQTGSSRVVGSYVYSYACGSSNYLDRSYTTTTTTGTSYYDSGSVTREPYNYNRYYEHYCYLRVPVSNVLTDTYKYTARQDQGY